MRQFSVSSPCEIKRCRGRIIVRGMRARCTLRRMLLDRLSAGGPFGIHPRLSRDRGHIVWFSNSSRYFPCLLFIIVNWYIVRVTPLAVEKLRGADGACGRPRSGRRRERNRSGQRRGVSLCKAMETRLLDYNTHRELPSLFLDAKAHGYESTRRVVYASGLICTHVRAQKWIW